MNIAFRPSPPTVPDENGRSPIAVARIEIFRDFASAEPTWRALEQSDSVCSPYQSRRWVELWHRHVSPHDATTPFLVAGFDADDQPLFLWPLGRGRLGPFAVAAFFGGKHATLNVALWRRDTADAMTVQAMQQVLRRVAQAAPDIDFVLLHNQPESWNGAANPFALLPRQRSTEENFVLPLGLPGAQIIEREISSSMRGRLRNKERKLARLPGYRYVRASTPDEVAFQLDSFFAQKAGKLEALGINNTFAQAGVEDFVRAACLEGLSEGKPVIELHALEGDGEMLALFSGVHDNWRFTSNFNSHTASEHSRHSPGLILLQHVVNDCADRGFAGFDIGPGEARYKSFFCKHPEPIFDSLLPLSARARVADVPMRALFGLKSTIKHSPVLWPVAAFLRRCINSLRRRAG